MPKVFSDYFTSDLLSLYFVLKIGKHVPIPLLLLFFIKLLHIFLVVGSLVILVNNVIAMRVICIFVSTRIQKVIVLLFLRLLPLGGIADSDCLTRV